MLASRAAAGAAGIPLLRRPRLCYPCTVADDPPPTAATETPLDAERLWPLLYDELRRLAAAKLGRESAAQTLQATALVHEAWLRLGGADQHTWQSRAHFFAAAAEAMRRILIDRARSRQAQRHGGGLQRVELEGLDLAATDDDRILAVNAALEQLGQIDPDKARLVKLRYFAGLSNEEAAQALAVSVPTAKRWWTFARAWLLAEMQRDADPGKIVPPP